MAIDSNVNQVYSQMRDYILEFSGQMSTLADKINFLHKDLAQKIKEFEIKIKEPQEVRPRPTHIGTEFMKKTYALLTIQETFYSTANDVKQETCEMINSLLEKYHTKALEISHAIMGEVQKYRDSEIEYNALYSKYIDAAKAYKDAKAHQKKIGQARSMYNHAFKCAKESHESYLKLSSQVELKIETEITRFEELEEWRGEQIRKILQTFSDHIFESAANFISAKSELYHNVVSLDTEAETKAITDFDFIRPAESEDRYQPWPFPRQITTILSPDQVFVNAPGAFKRAKSDYTPSHSNYLPLFAGEVVVVLEEKDNLFKCQNVNSSVGFVPQSCLENL